MSQFIKQVSADELTSLIEGDETVVCDFFATWCGPCRMLAPVMEEIAQEYSGKAVFVKMDIDDNEEFALEAGVRSIPDVYVFKGGEAVDHNLGYAPKAVLKEFVERNL